MIAGVPEPPSGLLDPDGHFISLCCDATLAE